MSKAYTGWMLGLIFAVAALFAAALVGSYRVGGNTTAWDYRCGLGEHKLVFSREGSLEFYTLTQEGQEIPVECGRTDFEVRRL